MSRYKNSFDTEPRNGITPLQSNIAFFYSYMLAKRNIPHVVDLSIGVVLPKEQLSAEEDSLVREGAMVLVKTLDSSKSLEEANSFFRKHYNEYTRHPNVRRTSYKNAAFEYKI
jgi:hypothetical protein